MDPLCLLLKAAQHLQTIDDPIPQRQLRYATTNSLERKDADHLWLMHVRYGYKDACKPGRYVNTWTDPKTLKIYQAFSTPTYPYTLLLLCSDAARIVGCRQNAFSMYLQRSWKFEYPPYRSSHPRIIRARRFAGNGKNGKRLRHKGYFVTLEIIYEYYASHTTTYH